MLLLQYMATHNALERPVTTPIHTFTHPEFENQVDLIGMIHTAQPHYYQTIQRRADTSYAHGAAVHYEKVRASSPEDLFWSEPEIQAKLVALGRIMQTTYSLFDGLDLGLVKQLDAMEYRSGWQNHDALDVEIVDRIGTFTLKRHQAVLSLLSLAYENMDPDERREQLRSTFLDALQDESKGRIGRVFGRVLLGSMDGAILKFRNEIALDAFDRQQDVAPGANMVLLWGADHLPGIGKGLKKRGYKKAEEERLVAIDPQMDPVRHRSESVFTLTVTWPG